MSSIQKKHLIIGGISFIIFLLLTIVFYLVRTQITLYNQPIPLSSDSLAPSSYIAKARPSRETIVETRLIAEKVNLQRKLIVPASPNDVASIEATVIRAGGIIIESSATTVVIELPKESESQVIEQLGSQQLAESVEVDYPVFITADQVDWGISKIEVPPVWATTQASGVKVAIIDTGIDYSHPDLRGRYIGGYDFFNDDVDPFDDHGHGTHVAGTVAADFENGGLQGAAPQSSLIAVKVLGADGTGYISDIIDGVDWAMKQGVQVMNFSLGTTYDSSALESKLAEAQSRGIHLVAAAGNTGGGPLLFPAAYTSVISVSATDSNDQFASFSSAGAELAAPGVAITSTIPGGGYATWSGTSMAAPHVSASVALMVANQQINIRERLHQTALDLGVAGKDSYFGYGRVVAKPAVLGEDVQAPVITFIEPKHTSEVETKVTIVLDIQDEFTVEAATLSANNTIISSWDSSPYTLEWDASSYINQEVTLVASAIDDSNNVGATQILIKIVGAVELSPSPTASPSPIASASGSPVSQKADQNNQVRQDAGTPAQEMRQDIYRVPQGLPPVTNYNQRNPQPTPVEQSSQVAPQSQPSGQSGSSQAQEAIKNNPSQDESQSSRRGKPEVKGASTVQCRWPFRFVCWLFG